MNEQQRMARPLAEVDPEIFAAVRGELERQDTRLELIASENFTSEAILEAAGTVFTNKYAEGYPGKRYYGGCEFVDVVENLARERAKKLFNAEYANVQPHSGSQANQAAYAAVLQPGDTVMGLNLAHGGHLTHGHQLNFSGKTYHVQAASGSTSTIRDGDTVMYTESISGNLFGLIPVTFSPDSPPPLNIPLIYFTNVKVTQAAQFGGSLHVPGMRVYTTD